jgi:hypothetical protein
MNLPGLLKIFSPKKPVLPDPYDGLAAISKFLRIKHRSSSFYQTYFKIVDMVEGFVEVLSNRNPELARALAGVNEPLSTTAATLRREMSQYGLDQDTVDFIDTGMPEIWPWLIRLMRDPTLPGYLEECRWVLEAISGGKIPKTATASPYVYRPVNHTLSPA